nr:PREDICTED: biotin--protein ligase [Latimeria chalumnae]|eukprot:XP_014345401.1 PREDICTED: biotin--protein ligase [Latimeria chalumnae]
MLGTAFMEGRLQMDDGLVPHKIVSVQLSELALQGLQEANLPSKENSTEEQGAKPRHASSQSTDSKDDPNQITGMISRAAGHGQTQLLAGKSTEELERDQNSVSRDPDDGCSENEQDLGWHRHLHLSSCHECLELETSTIESVKFASAENIPDLPDNYFGSPVHSAACGDGAGRFNRPEATGKPPNVLVYVGAQGMQADATFLQIKSVLLECIDRDSYVIYPLLEEQVLRDPWVDNAALLVIATMKPVPQEVHQIFMTYLSKGGKVLGLSGLFCFGGVKLSARNELKEKVQKMRYTKSDVALNILTSGSVFEKDVGSSFASGHQLWGQLENPEKHMIIVHQCYGDNGGEAILCQVHLEIPPESAAVQTSEAFNALKVSNAQRYEVLVDVLSSLSLSCEVKEVPCPTPLHLLTPKEEIRLPFLQWLWAQADSKGVVKSPKVSLKLLSPKEPAVQPTLTLVPVITEPADFSSELFDLNQYRQNLQTKSLGQIVLFAEVTTTTMDLFDGLMLQLPEEMGLIAIAVRQTQGKGRGGNAWLSSLGCAMFTLHISIPLPSQLGQSITFLQHLVALAVVESVKSLPGYQDIDLRLKWPNDIYYSDVMKLGGVLVTSTLMGTTFHVLIGCGFNVSNSSPTICINDLIAQYNKENGAELKPLGIDQLIARTVTVLENLINTFQDKGPNGILPLYYKHWLHSATSVRLWRDDGPVAQVIGLDDSGFLQVQQEDGSIVSVQPDGNSFDMLRNLIVTKTR